jgi:hypothetical protein
MSAKLSFLIRNQKFEGFKRRCFASLTHFTARRSRSALGGVRRGADPAPQTLRFGGNWLRASLGAVGTARLAASPLAAAIELANADRPEISNDLRWLSDTNLDVRLLV